MKEEFDVQEVIVNELAPPLLDAPLHSVDYDFTGINNLLSLTKKVCHFLLYLLSSNHFLAQK